MGCSFKPEDPQPLDGALAGLSCWSGLPTAADVCEGGGSVTLIPTFSLPSPRWLSYLLLFILDLVICLVTCLGLARRSKCLLAS